MSFIIGANSAVAGGFDVDNSCRFSSASSDKLTRTFGSGGSVVKWTWSSWFKVSAIGGDEQVFFSKFTDTNNFSYIKINGNSKIEFRAKASSSTVLRYTLTRQFRDPSVWTHLVVALDTSLGTSTDRIKIWINGVRETAFDTSTAPAEDAVTLINSAAAHEIAHAGDGSDFFNGYMSQVCFVDNAQYDADQFGEYNEDSGIWTPINVSGLTFGATSFFLDFADSADLGDDESGNSNDWTEVNITAIDQTTDTCTNNFVTLNPLFPEANIAYSEGNTRVTADGSTNWSSVISTIGLATGKWYWEWKATSTSNCFTGIASETLVNSGVLISDTTPYDATGLILYFTSGRLTVDGSDTESYFTAWGSGTMSAALDLDSGTRTIQMYHNGSATGSAVNLTANFAAGNLVFPVFMVNAGSYPSVQNPNFGNPNTANSSDAADGDGYGNFEYAPPSGYFALCTKNLAEYG